MTSKPRLHALDSLRGITMLSMIVYHLMWDLVYLYGIDAPWYRSAAAHLWQQSICWTFILLSGFCHGLGRHPVRRGLTVYGASVLVSLATYLFMPDDKILHGVLGLIGISMLLCVPVGRLTQSFSQKSAAFASAASFLLFLLMRDVPHGRISFMGISFCTLPDVLYRNDFTALFGFPGDTFRSSDYFPLLPWFFLYLTGFFLFRALRGTRVPELLTKPKLPLFAWMGRHALLIYLLHQPLIAFILFLCFR